MLSHQSFGGVGSGMPGSWRREHIQINSAGVIATDLYSASVEDLETVGCLRELQEIKLEPRKTQYAPVEQRSSGHPTQSASE